MLRIPQWIHGLAFTIISTNWTYAISPTALDLHLFHSRSKLIHFCLGVTPRAGSDFFQGPRPMDGSISEEALYLI